FELVKFVYSSSKDQVAELSMVVVKEAEKGNKQAIEILKEAGQKLADQVAMLIEKLNMQEHPKVAVTGSVLEKNDLVFESFEKFVKAKYRHTEVIMKDIFNTIGWYYYYKNS